MTTESHANHCDKTPNVIDNLFTLPHIRISVETAHNQILDNQFENMVLSYSKERCGM